MQPWVVAIHVFYKHGLQIVAVPIGTLFFSSPSTSGKPCFLSPTRGICTTRTSQSHLDTCRSNFTRLLKMRRSNVCECTYENRRVIQRSCTVYFDSMLVLIYREFYETKIFQRQTNLPLVLPWRTQDQARTESRYDRL